MIRRFLVVFVSFALPGLLMAQGVKDEVLSDINKAAGLNYVYDYKTEPACTKAPKGYRPFYISHLGRHGARYQFSYYDSVEVWLGKAAKAEILTPFGEEFEGKLKDFHAKVHYKEGDLTPIGKDQHMTIAGRMYRNYRDVFKGDTRVWAVSTTSPRVILSMVTFWDTLKDLDKKMEVSFDASQSCSPYLNPASKGNPAYVRRPFTTKETDAAIKAFLVDSVDWRAVYGRFFTDVDAASGIGIKPDRFINALHHVTSGMQCLDHDRNLFEGTFTPEEEFDFLRYRTMKEAAVMANYSESVSNFYKYSAYTLRHIIETADSDFESGEYNIRLRFCHDSNIMPMLHILNVNGMGREITDLVNAVDIFPIYEIPMGASLQFIFYRSARNPEILVKVLHNEREAQLPFESVEGPYYSWSKFKDYYQPGIDSMIQELEALRSNKK